MPTSKLKSTAKRKAIRTTKRKIRRKKKSGNKLPLILLILLILTGTGVAWHFGLIPDLDELLWGRNNTPAIVAVDGTAQLHFIDVGQADANLIITDDGTMLIDSGNRHTGPRVVEYIRNLGITTLTYVVATHPHEDHIGGMNLILHEFDIGTLMLPPVSHISLTYERMIAAIEDNDIHTIAPVAGDVFTLGGAIFTVIHPNSNHYRDLNDWSISFRMAFGAVSMVTTGDAERLAEREMIEAGHYLGADTTPGPPRQPHQHHSRVFRCSIPQHRHYPSRRKQRPRPPTSRGNGAAIRSWCENIQERPPRRYSNHYRWHKS